MNNKILIKNLLLIFVSLSACILMFSKPEVSTSGISEGLTLCAGTVIPSLFPFMIVSQFILKSGLADFIGSILDKPVKKIFRLPGVAASVIMMSLIGGFPVGAKMTSDLLQSNKITENQAQRLNLFCINAGPAFIIGTVGSMFLGSRKAGIILYASTCISSILIGLLSSVIADKAQALPPNEKTRFMESPVSAFAQSTIESAKAMISICAWIVIFSAIIKYITSLGTDSWLVTVCAVLEVTSGIKLSLGILPVPAIAAILSFSGLSVHCQIYSYVSKSRLTAKYFYTARIMCAALSSFICTGLLKLFPCEISTFATNSDLVVNIYSMSLPAAIALIIMCAVLIFEVDTDKKIC